MPVASFCASETAETGRIANGREQGDHVSRRQSGKGFNWASAKFWFECADSRFAEPRRVSKGFNFVSAWSLFGGADSRFGKPRISLQGRTDLFFSLVRKEPKVPEGLRPSRLPGTIQSSVGNNLREASDGTSRNRFFAQNGGEKALNRCDARALQRKDLEWRLKERPYSLRTVGYGWVQVGDGGQKRKAFSAHARQCKNEKPFINQLWQHFSTMPKLTCSYKFHLRNPTVSLQQNIPFSKLRSPASAQRLPFRTDSNPHRRYSGSLRFPVPPVT